MISVWRGGSPHESAADGAQHEFGDAVEFELFHDARAVGFDGVDTDAETGGDLLTSESFGEEVIDMALASGEGFVKIVVFEEFWIAPFALTENSRDGGAEVRLAVMDALDGFEEPFLDGILEKVALGSGANGADDVPFIAMHAEDEDAGLRGLAQDALDGFDAVQLLHADINHRYVGEMQFGLFNGLAAGGGFGDHQQIGIFLENAAHSGAKEAMIIGEKNADGHQGRASAGFSRARSGTGSKGSTRRILVPPPGEEATSSVPSNAVARSRIPGMP